MSKFIGRKLLNALAEAGVFPADWKVRRVHLKARVRERCVLVVERREFDRTNGFEVLDLTEEIELAWMPLFEALEASGIIARPSYTRAIEIDAAIDKACLVKLELFGDDDEVIPALAGAARVAAESQEALVA